MAKGLGAIVSHANSMGYEVTLGEVGRSDEQAEINALGTNGRAAVAQLVEHAFPWLAAKIRNNGKNNGIRNSLHTLRCAVDLQLFTLDGTWITDVAPYAELGAFWKSLALDHRWGGDFGDTPHYSIEFNGVK